MKKKTFKIFFTAFGVLSLFAASVIFKVEQGQPKISLNTAHAWDTGDDEDADKSESKSETTDTYSVEIPVEDGNPLCYVYIVTMTNTECIGKGKIECYPSASSEYEFAGVGACS